MDDVITQTIEKLSTSSFPQNSELLSKEKEPSIQEEPKPTSNEEDEVEMSRPKAEERTSVSTLEDPTNSVSKPSSTLQNTKDSGKYYLIRTIGKGNFAKVKLAIHMATGVEVAIKIINKTQMRKNLLDRLATEIRIMKKNDHPNIIKLLEIIETEESLCLVMECANGGEIFDYLVTHGNMREREARAKFRQLVSAIHYCHTNNIVHRDLKAENILLDSNLDVKVADFGLANEFSREDILKTFCGSPPYAAPELFLGIPYYGPCVDIWSLGVILFTLVVGHLPFEANNMKELKSKVLQLQYSFPRNSVSRELKSLIGMMLVVDPRHRASLKPIMEHHWTNIGYENEPLKPYTKPVEAPVDETRIAILKDIGYSEEQIRESVIGQKFDHIYASYHLIKSKPSQFPKMHQDINSDTITEQTQITLPKSIVRGGTTNSKSQADSPVKPTNVGRFTVKKADNETDSGQPSPSSPVLSNNATPTGTQYQSKSYTASMPTAIRKVLANFGRTVSGNPENSVIREERSTTSDSQSRSKPYMDQYNRSGYPKKNPQKLNMLTTAPVPMFPGPMKMYPPNGPTSVMRQSSTVANSQNLEENHRTWHSGNVPAQIRQNQKKLTSSSQNPSKNASHKSLNSQKLSPAYSENRESLQTKPASKTGSITGPLVTVDDNQPQKNLNGNKIPEIDSTDSGEKTPIMGSLINETEGMEPVNSEKNFSTSKDLRKGSLHNLEPQNNSCTTLNEPRKSTFFKNFIPKQLRDNMKYEKPREVMFPWSIDTTSTKKSDVILEEIIKALKNYEGIRFIPDKNWKYLIHCGYKKNRKSIAEEEKNGTFEPLTQLSKDDEIMFEVEICCTPRMTSMNGIRLKRIRGEAIDYKNVADAIIGSINL